MKTYAPNQGLHARREPAATRDKTVSSTTGAASWKSLHSDRFDAVQRSPRMVAQRQALRAAFGEKVQLLQAGREEKPPLQSKDLLLVQGMEEPEDEELIQGKRTAAQLQAGMDEDELLQGQFSPTQLASVLEDAMPLQGKWDSIPISKAVQNQATPAINHTGMPDQLKAGIESLSGMDLSDVRVHTNSDRPARLDAAAYAQGNEIHLGPGQEQHLPHEAWHVVQQRRGRVHPTLQFHNIAINDDAAREAEADVMGQEALQRKRHGGTIQLGKKNRKKTNRKPKNKVRKNKNKTYTHSHDTVSIIFEKTERNTQIQELTTNVLERYVEILETSITERMAIDEEKGDGNHRRWTKLEEKRLGRLVKELAKR
jgi:hypothetical protein